MDINNNVLIKNYLEGLMIDKDPTISVSIVTFNNLQVLEQRLGILLPLFKMNHVSTVYIIDNNSTDGTSDFLNIFSKQEPLLKIILLDSNEGFGHGHNQAIYETKCKYHVVMNLDTTPKQEQVIFNMGSYMEEHSEIDLLSPLVFFPDKKVQYLTRDEPTVFDLAIRFLGSRFFPKRQEKFIHLNDGYNHAQIIRNATGSFMFLRTSTLKKIGGFDERYFMYMEDTDLTKTINQGGRAFFSPNFQVIHEWQRKNHSFSGSRRMLISMIKYFNKWGWKLW